MLDDKQRIHNQWAAERRSLDHRIKVLEQNGRHNDGQYNGYPANNGFYSSSHQQTSNQSMPTNTRAAVFHDPTIQQMEELRQKIADRRGGPTNPSTTWMNRMNRPGPQSPTHHTRSASGSALTEYSQINTTVSTQSPTKIISLVNPIGHHSSASSADSTTNSSDSISPSTNHQINNHSSTTTVNTSSNVHFSSPNRSSATNNRMASKMPTSNLSSYIENLPAATRRRFAEQNNVVKKRTAVALGSGYRRSAWNSSNENSTTSPKDRHYDSLSTAPATSNVSTASSDDNHLNLTVVEVNNSKQP